MESGRVLSSSTHLLLSPHLFSPPAQPSTSFPRVLYRPSKFTLFRMVIAPAAARGSAPEEALPEAERVMLEAIADLEGDSALPCVRSYENDFARLTVVGPVDYSQALTAAAADGGKAATDHLASGMNAMVVETVFPADSDEHSTVSTRLFLPTRKVKEKARRLRGYMTEDMLGSTDPRNILAMTFRQVVMERLWNFELVSLLPGSERNMDDIGSTQEAPFSFNVSSSDEGFIVVLAEAICFLVLDNVAGSPRNSYPGHRFKGWPNWISRTKMISSKDSSVTIYQFEDEIVENAKSLLERFNSEKDDYEKVKETLKNSWWKPITHSKLEKIGGPLFSCWISEYIPAYRIEVDDSRLKDLKLEGWKRTAENRWEVLLTHSQMIGLVNVLDMLLEDPYALSNGQLSCSVFENPKRISKRKKDSPLLRILSTTLASAVFLVSISLVVRLGPLGFPHLFNRGNLGSSESVRTSEIENRQPLVLERSELEASCSTVIRKIKEGYGWEGNMKSDPDVGSWVGELPAFLLRNGANSDLNGRDDTSTSRARSSNNDQELKLSAQNIASYQVVLSVEGGIVGFQPTSRLAVNHWASNPLAKELYGGKKLMPGLLEPGLKITKPSEVIVLELLISVTPGCQFALARPLP